MSDPDAAKLRTAYHEAAHAVIAELLGVRVDLVSVRLGEHHRGITIHASFGYDAGVTDLLARRHGKDLLARWGVVPYAFFDAEKRRRAECSIMVALAGHLGELLMPELATGYRDDTAEIDQARAMAAAVELTAEQSAWLDDAEHGEPHRGDDEAAFDTARWNIGEEAAGAFVNYLSWETQRLMFSPLVRSLVPPVVDELLRHEVIPGDLVREVVQRITGERLEHEEATKHGASSSQADRSIPNLRRHTAQSADDLHEGGHLDTCRRLLRGLDRAGHGSPSCGSAGCVPSSQ